MRPPFSSPFPDSRLPSVGLTAQRVVVTLLAAVAAVAQVAYLDAVSWHAIGLVAPLGTRLDGPLLVVMTGHAVVSLVSGTLAVVLVLHEGPRQRAARGLGLAMASWSYLTAYSGVTLLGRPMAASLRSAFDGHFLVVELAGLAGLLAFTACFPKPLAETRLELPPTLPRALAPVHAATVWMLEPWAPWAAGAGILVLLWAVTAVQGVPLSDAGLGPLMDVVRFAAAGLVVVNLRRSWGRASADEAARMAWLLAALVSLSAALLLLVGGNVLLAVTDFPEPGVAWRPLLIDLGLVAFLIAAAMSVLHRGRVDAVVAAKRIGAIAVVTTVGLFLAAALEVLFTGALQGLSLRTGVGTLLAFAVVVATHRGLMRSIEKVFAQVPGLGRV